MSIRGVFWHCVLYFGLFGPDHCDSHIDLPLQEPLKDATNTTKHSNMSCEEFQKAALSYWKVPSAIIQGKDPTTPTKTKRLRQISTSHIRRDPDSSPKAQRSLSLEEFEGASLSMKSGQAPSKKAKRSQQPVRETPPSPSSQMSSDAIKNRLIEMLVHERLRCFNSDKACNIDLIDSYLNLKGYVVESLLSLPCLHLILILAHISPLSAVTWHSQMGHTSEHSCCLASTSC